MHQLATWLARLRAGVAQGPASSDLGTYLLPVAAA